MTKALITLFTLLFIVGCCEKNTTEPDYNSSFEIHSSHYVNNCFYLDHPELMYDTYSEEEIIDLDFPSGWANNAIELDDYGQWKLNYDYYPNLPNLSTLRVFLDDGLANNNAFSIQGYEIDVPDSIYNFRVCTIGVDFYIKNYMLIFENDPWLNPQAVGVTYVQNDSTQVGQSLSLPIEVKLLKKPYQTFINDPDYWKLQVRNSYKYDNIYINSDSYPRIGFKNDNNDPLITSIPDSIDLGSYHSINSFIDYLRLDTNYDLRVNSEDTSFGTEHFLIQFPFIHPFKPFIGNEMYQQNSYYEYGNYYIRIEDTYHY